MSFLSFIPIIGKLIDKGLDVVDELVEDKDKANELKHAIKDRILIQNHDFMIKKLEAQSNIILAEAGGGWLQRNWRPILMLIAIIILANNFIIAPYVGLLFGKSLMLTLPNGLWVLLNIGVGGYIGGRTVEKIKSNGSIPKLNELLTD